MEQDTQKLHEEIQTLLKNGEESLKELEAMKHCVEFAQNEWASGNTRWFREEPGHVTTKDVIKTCIEYAWAARGNYEHEKSRRMASGPHNDVSPEEK